MIGFQLTSGIQEGRFNLNDREIEYKIKFNDYSKKYFIELYEAKEFLLGGVCLSNGTDILYNKEHLGLGKSLIYRGFNDLSSGFLIYKVE